MDAPRHLRQTVKGAERGVYPVHRSIRQQDQHDASLRVVQTTVMLSCFVTAHLILLLGMTSPERMCP